ncbi:MAG: hypothetical protein JKP98_13565 [Rhodobacteraceae bacterium]|jgi:hypothetical protein|nr:hypothetical protein [Paracoccaceae bacterium]MBL4557763.1 hypothetical protein [Paracoccaceae bacterium]
MEYVEHEFEINSQILRKLTTLTDTSNLAAIRALLFDYAVIAFAVYIAVGISYWLYPISLILIGSTQRAFVNLLHETVHGMLAKNKVLNFLESPKLPGRHRSISVFGVSSLCRVPQFARWISSPTFW